MQKDSLHLPKAEIEFTTFDNTFKYVIHVWPLSLHFCIINFYFHYITKIDFKS